MTINNFAPSPPDFEKMTWRCHCCNVERTSNHVKIMKHDIGKLFGSDTGSICVNVRYCVDMIGCKEKAFNREWVITRFFPTLVNEMNNAKT